MYNTLNIFACYIGIAFIQRFSTRKPSVTDTMPDCALHVTDITNSSHDLAARGIA